MASLSERFSKFLRSRQGQKLARRAQQLARDPRTRRTVEQWRTRMARKR